MSEEKHFTHTLTDAAFQAEVIESDKITLIDFWAPWCPPCLMMAPRMEEIAEKYQDNPDVVVAKINVDENPASSEQYRVMSIPCFKVFKGGKVVGQVVGATSPEKIIDLIEAAITMPAAA